MKRIFALFLCLCLCLTLLPAAAAEDIETIDEPVRADAPGGPSDRPDKTAPAPDAEIQAEVSAWGACGEEVEWYLYDDGLLYLTGSGPTWNFPEDYPAFYKNYRSDVKSVIVGEGVTGLGSWLFYDLPELREVDLKKDLRAIGACCFRNCPKLTGLRFRGLPPVIGENCFKDTAASIYYYPVSTWEGSADQDYGGSLTWICDNKCGDDVTWRLNLASKGSNANVLVLSGSGATWDFRSEFPGFYEFRDLAARLSVSDGVTEVGPYAFWGMTALSSVVLWDSMAKLGDYAFACCGAFEMIFFECCPSFGDSVFNQTWLVAIEYSGLDEQWKAFPKGTYGAQHILWAARYTRSGVEVSIASSILSSTSNSVRIRVSDFREEDKSPFLVVLDPGDGYFKLSYTTDPDWGEETRFYDMSLASGANYFAVALKGDVDLNGAVESRDGNMVSRHSVKKFTITNPLALCLADIDGNGKIESRDGNMISRAAVNKYTIPW